MKRVCRVCMQRSAMPPITVVASCRGKFREWPLTVCLDCWRVFETMLDEGAPLQHGLPDGLPASPIWWFR